MHSIQIRFPEFLKRCTNNIKQRFDHHQTNTKSDVTRPEIVDIVLSPPKQRTH